MSRYISSDTYALFHRGWLANVGSKGRWKKSTPLIVKRSAKNRHLITGVLFVWFQALLFFYWSGFPLLNTVFVYGYPRFGTPPSPNFFKQNRYGLDWIFISSMIGNGLLPMLLMWALLEHKTQELARIWTYVAIGMAFLNFACILFFLVRWGIWCNTSWSQSSVCNDYRWCCVNYASTSGDAVQWCSNTTPCTPTVTSSDLRTNGEYTQHLIFAAGFFVMALANLGLAHNLSEVGYFSNEDFD
jgi:hypothetical protein